MIKKTSVTNERELVSKLTEWFNEIINRNKFPFKEATNESPAKYDTKTFFGDIVLWKDREAAQAHTYLEIKPPFAAKENLETLRKKAIGYQIKYCFTWDFQNLNAYKLESNQLSLLSSEPAQAMDNINDWLRGDIQVLIKKYLSGICDEIIHLNETGKLRKFKPDKVYFVNFIRDTVEKLVPQFERHYTEIAKDKYKRNRIRAYATTQGIALSDISEYYKLIARQSVYSLITKIIFYLTIRRYFNDLPDLYSNDDPELERTLKIAFAKAQEKDWQAVFEDSEIEEFGIPASCHDELRSFFTEMKVYHFGELPEDVIGELFEEIIDPEKRHLLGQYFTNEDLIDLILGFVVNDVNAVYADTTCGSGTFLIRIYDRLKYLSKQIKHAELLDRIWGFDIAKFPAELTTINLFKQDVSNFENFPRVRRTNIFDVNKGDSYKFPPASANKTFSKVEIKLPEFSSIVGNFPFIRQEDIEKEEKGFKLYLTKVLAHSYFLSYPKFFEIKSINTGQIEHLKALTPDKLIKEIDNFVDKGNLKLKLSGQADIYTYIFIHTATLLAEKGSFAVITSNSWLDSSYGSALKEFFLDNFKVKTIIASWAEPWFDDAAVNTVITVLEKETDKNERNKNISRFVKLKKKLSELIPYHDLKLESVKRWQTVEKLVDMIEMAEGNLKAEIITDDITSLDVNEMRIRMVKQSFLQKDLELKGDHSKWGKYLRAPDVYFELLDKCKDKLVQLKNVADVRFGIKTGINEFFYLEQLNMEKNPKGCVYCRNARGWEGYIEEKYLRPIIKSPKESDSIIIDPAKLKYKIFLCNKSKNDLRKAAIITH
jgi:type I restriction enzyme M protein